MKVRRFGVSLEEDLLEKLDRLSAKHKFPNRSQAIRFLIRSALVEEARSEDREVAGVIVIIYDHHKGAWSTGFSTFNTITPITSSPASIYTWTTAIVWKPSCSRAGHPGCSGWQTGLWPSRVSSTAGSSSQGPSSTPALRGVRGLRFFGSGSGVFLERQSARGAPKSCDTGKT